jgi:hypothetical protein
MPRAKSSVRVYSGDQLLLVERKKEREGGKREREKREG